MLVYSQYSIVLHISQCIREMDCTGSQNPFLNVVGFSELAVIGETLLNVKLCNLQLNYI